MTIATDNPTPPFRAVQETGGAWPDRFTWWTVVDAEGKEPHGEAWCRRVADALNEQEHGHPGAIEGSALEVAGDPHQ